MKQLLLLLLLIWFSDGVISAQQYQFKNYKVEEGLVSNETIDILQDSKNRIWVSTVSGVSCFDGQNFTNYTIENGLASNVCFSIFEDSKGRIWVGTFNKGISFIENGKVTNIKSEKFDNLGIVTHFLEDKDGSIYIFCVLGIAKYNNGQISILTESILNPELSDFQDAAWYDSNTIYIASSEKGIYKMTLDPFKIENIYNQDNGVNNICYSVVVDEDKNIWVGAYGELYKIVNNTLTKYKFKPEDFDKNRIHDIHLENENELYLSFEGNGLGIFNKKTGDLELINESKGLPTNYIYRTIKDTEGNFWMTSYGEGIIRFRDSSFKIYKKEHGLPAKSAYAAIYWNNEMILATDNGLLSISEKNEVKTLVKDTQVKNIFVTPANTLLFTTNKDVRELSTNGSEKLIDEGYYNLLYKDEKYTFLFETERIKVLAKDSTYFIKTNRSIAIVPIEDRYILCKVSGLFQTDGISVDTIPKLNRTEHYNFRSIDVISKNEVIAGSESKIYYVKLKDGQFQTKIFNMERFKNLKSFKALKVDNNDLWLAGRDLFIKVDLGNLLKNDTVIAKNYKTIPNFLKNEVDFNSLFVTKNKSVLASSLDGLLVLDEKAYIPLTQPPKIDLRNVRLFSEPLIDSLYSTEKGIMLPYEKNYLSFSMQAITFTYPENIYYKYRMKGLRDGNEWSEPTKDPNVVFSYLPPGAYTFEFTADNGVGLWQQNPYEYSFTITVPFWRTWIFWASVVSFSTLLFFLIYYYRNKAEKKRNETYTHNLIQGQEEERIRVARELHDSVGQKLMLLAKKTKSTGNPEMEFLATNTLEELRTISRGLHPANLERLGPTAAIINMINEVDNNTNIFFTHEIEDIDALLSRDASLHLYRIIQEVLNNIVKHAEAKAASVTIEKKKNTIEATISDNGKGFENSEKIRNSASLGMKTLLERAKILHSKIDIKSQINKGTTVTLTIPI